MKPLRSLLTGPVIYFAIILAACTPASTPVVPEPTPEQPTTEVPAATSTPEPTEVPASSGPFTLVQPGPVFNKNLNNFDPGAVFPDNGQWVMFPNADSGTSQEIWYATSPDALDWDTQSEERVISTRETTFASFTSLVTTGVLADDGSWVTYFYGWDDSVKTLEDTQTKQTAIGRSVASVAEGPWVANPDPVLKPGGAGEWDAFQIKHPSVVKSDNGYVMFYTGITRAGDEAIGMAISPDGIAWTKYNDPTTSEAPYAESDPVFTHDDEGAWDGLKVFQPSVQITPDGWVMVYKGDSGEDTPDALGLAFSEDGITWTRSGDAPIMVPADIPDGQVIWFCNLQYVEGTYYLFIEASKLARGNHTAIYLATHEGSLK